MSERKWTPGPWDVAPFGSYGWEVQGDGQQVALVRQARPWKYDAETSAIVAKAEADAHLIASAPDLHGALEAMDEAFRLDRTRFNDAQRQAVRLMDAALAKARGEHQPEPTA